MKWKRILTPNIFKIFLGLACVNSICTKINLAALQTTCTSNFNCTNQDSYCNCPISATSSSSGFCSVPDSAYTSPHALNSFKVFNF